VPGRLLDEETDGDYRASFAHDHPSDELILIAGPYQVHERMAGEVRVRTYFHPELAGLEGLYLDKTEGYLGRFARRIGAYPFAAFHVVSSPLPVGLGFPYLTYMGTRVLKLPFIPHTSLGHEVLHAWWGNGVLVDYQNGNWSEGLTTFMADYAFAEQKGAAEARAMRLRWLRDFAALPRSRDQPLRHFVARRHGAGQVVGYNKAAMLFYMLRDEIGRPAFDAGIRAFWAQHRLGKAAWADLRRAFEGASGVDLERSFGQWLERRGAPALELGAVTVGAAQGGYALSVTLRQGAPAFDLMVPVVVSTAAGEERHRLRLDGLEARHTIPSAAQPLALAVDPDFELLRRLAPAETPPILREVMLAPEVAVVVAVGDAEAGAAADALVEALLEGRGRGREAKAARLAGLPVLVVGTAPDVNAALASAGLDPVPAALRDRGTARAWAGRRPGGEAVLTVSAADAAALRSLLRPLPHYGARSFLVFEGARALDKGVWPPGPSPLRVELR
jgi:hypothetical protein